MSSFGEMKATTQSAGRRKLLRRLVPVIGAVAVAPIVVGLSAPGGGVVSVGATSSVDSELCSTARRALSQAYFSASTKTAPAAAARGDFLSAVETLAQGLPNPVRAQAGPWIDAWRGYLVGATAMPDPARLRLAVGSLQSWRASQCRDAPGAQGAQG
jgi:hypothetical protein